MKKILAVVLILLLLLTGLFFWKGGHHAIYLAEALEEWLDADDADQSLTLMVMVPGAQVNDDTGRFEPHIAQYTLSAETFWTEYGDRPLFGLTAENTTAYTDGKNLYFDTGKAYALPELTELRKNLRELAFGMLLHGRVTKQGEIYNISMKTDDMELDVDVTLDRTVRAVNVMAILPDDTSVVLQMDTLPTNSHSIPKTVLDAMVRSRMEMPMILTEPLSAILPALDGIFPLRAETKLTVECGILNISETVDLTLTETQAELVRDGITVTLSLPETMKNIPPAALGLYLLATADFVPTADGAVFTVPIPPEMSKAMLSSLVPQAAELDITFTPGEAVLTLSGGKIDTLSLTADGTIPVLIAELPLSFRAEFDIK